MGATTSPKPGWKADPGRRRSMRVLLSVPILVSGKTANNEDFKEETRTLVVNAHGSLIALAAQVVAQQVVTLGLSVGVLQQKLPNDARVEAYQCDITYGTASEFG